MCLFTHVTALRINSFLAELPLAKEARAVQRMWLAPPFPSKGLIEERRKRKRLMCLRSLWHPMDQALFVLA